MSDPEGLVVEKIALAGEVGVLVGAHGCAPVFVLNLGGLAEWIECLIYERRRGSLRWRHGGRGGAGEGIRTPDIFLGKEVLYH